MKTPSKKGNRIMHNIQGGGVMDKFEPKIKKLPKEVAESIHRVPEVDFSLWDSPIQIIETVPRTSYEDGIYNTVKEVGVVVDKERLIDVLMSDRKSYADGYLAGYEAAQPKWISVKECEPELGVEVLTCDGYNNIHVAYRTSENLYYREDVIGYLAYFSASYWMPLPEAPKEEA